MNQCSIFQLNVLRTGLDCTFQLMWGEREQIVATLKYPQELDGLYRDWKTSYLKAYGTPMRGKVADGFSVTPRRDWKNIAEEAKENLLQTFEQWLGGAELLEIRQRIYRETARKNSQNQQKTDGNCVDLLMACNCLELVRLPWEGWKIAPKEESLAPIHISRTPINAGNEAILVKNSPRRGKPRILAVLADTSELDLQKDREAVQSLKKVTDVNWFKRQEGENGEEFKQRFIEQLVDERGWDVLIFAGHSDETERTGGRLELAPDAIVSMTEIKEELIQAKNQGLQVAIFNSCSGLSIAESLIEWGLSQVVVMREKSHDSVNHVFLNRLCQSLAEYKDIQQAIQDACNYLKSEKNAYPSAYLIPSLFRHPASEAELFRIERLGWRRWWRDWKPSRKEAIWLSTVLLLSLMTPLQGELFNLRTAVQAIYRDKTRQLPQATSAPVRLISIDQESLNEANLDTVNPMRRDYLAKLIKQFSQSNARVIGLNYLLDDSRNEDEILGAAIRDAVKQKSTWFVFAKEEYEPGVNIEANDTIASTQWSLQGEFTIIYSPSWQVMLPAQGSCQENCPFAYILAQAQALHLQPPAEGLPQPKLDSSDNFQNLVSALENKITSLKRGNLPLGIQPIIDFSIPPDRAYNRMSAWQFLDLPPNASEFKEIEQQVVVIAPGGYDRANDNFHVPLAVRYWRSNRGNKRNISRKWFTGGEAHAYMIHHLLSQHLVVSIPAFWLVGAAAILGKGTSLMLQKQKRRQQQKWAVRLIGATAAYGLVGLQLYVSSLVLLAWFLPSVTFWIFIFSVIRRKSYA